MRGRGARLSVAPTHSEEVRIVLFDAITSGGLLLAVPEERVDLLIKRLEVIKPQLPLLSDEYKKVTPEKLRFPVVHDKIPTCMER